MTTTISTNAKVGDLVTQRPGRSRTFNKLGIDFCCGGQKSLEQACREKSLDPAEVAAMLDSDLREGEQDPSPWAEASPSELCDHLESTHHVYLREELPRLEQMLAKVASVHGERHPEMKKVHALFVPFAQELLMHMQKEERVLFPVIRGQSPMAIDVSAPITVMEREHDDAGEVLRQLRSLTGDYQPPEDACNTFRAVLDGLEELEQDLHLHVHKENNILFPKALEAAG